MHHIQHPHPTHSGVDMTEGNITGHLIRFALPLLAGNIFQQLYNIADSLVAGKFIGENALAAVGNSYEITLIFIAFAFGCNIGCSVIVSRYFGAKDYDEMKTSVYTSLIGSAVLCAVLMLIGLVGCHSLLELINTPEEILADSSLYLDIYVLGLPFMFFYNIATGIFSALGDSKTPFYFLAVSSLSNIGVDILFVAGFKMGVAGVAWATFLCQGIAAALALGVVIKRLKSLPESEKAPWFSADCLKELSLIAIPSILQQGFISVGNIMIQSMINGFGMAAVGGYSAAVKLNNMTITSVTAIGNGMSNYTAQNAGAGLPERIETGLSAGIKLAVGIAFVFTGLYLLAGPVFVGLFITDGNQAALSAGVLFLRIVSPFYLVIAVKLIADGILRGVNRMKLFMSATLTDLVIRVVCAAIFSRGLGLTGIWLSWPIGWIIAASLSLFFYRAVKQQRFDIPPTDIRLETAEEAAQAQWVQREA